jgi:hypothetical protein
MLRVLPPEPGNPNANVTVRVYQILPRYGFFLIMRGERGENQYYEGFDIVLDVEVNNQSVLIVVCADRTRKSLGWFSSCEV